jgi:hypothetical protein
VNSGEIMVVCIVAIVMIASILKSRGRLHQDAGGDDHGHTENQRLRDEVTQLKERLKVLERITVEKENSLSREIEQLRDHS